MIKMFCQKPKTKVTHLKKTTMDASINSSYSHLEDSDYIRKWNRFICKTTRQREINSWSQYEQQCHFAGQKAIQRAKQQCNLKAKRKTQQRKGLGEVIIINPYKAPHKQRIITMYNKFGWPAVKISEVYNVKIEDVQCILGLEK